jgi:hypothetical protein
VRFVEIGRRPARRMVGMRMVETHYVLAAFPRLSLDGDQLLGRNVVSIVGGIGPRVAGPDGQFNLVDAIQSLPEQHSATHKMVTMTASLPAAASSSPIRKLAATAAAAEMPNNRPSDRPKRLAIS